MQMEGGMEGERERERLSLLGGESPRRVRESSEMSPWRDEESPWVEKEPLERERVHRRRERERGVGRRESVKREKVENPWRDKDIPLIKRAPRETGSVKLSGFLSEAVSPPAAED